MSGAELLAALLAAVRAAPALPGARCRGRHHLFDEDRPGEAEDTVAYRHQHALRLCNGCPALERCREWFNTLPKRERPQGVIAGLVNLPSPVGRPKKASA